MSTSRLVSLFLAVIVVVAVLIVQAGAAASALTNNDRARQADVARWVALGEYDKKVGANAVFDPKPTADTARWVALGEFYTQRNSAAISNATRSALTASARYTGQAIQEYVRTGIRIYLPKCISSEIMFMLLPIGDNSWKTQVALCGK